MKKERKKRKNKKKEGKKEERKRERKKSKIWAGSLNLLPRGFLRSHQGS